MIPKITPTIPKRIIFSKAIFPFIKLYNFSNCSTNANPTNIKKISKSTIRSATIVPKPLSNGTFSYLFNKAALVISPTFD